MPDGRRARADQVAKRVNTAVELLDESLDGDDDYRFLGAFDGDELVGYACFGPTPDTLGTFDLYWIAVERSRQGTEIGLRILHRQQFTQRDATALRADSLAGNVL